MKYHVLGNWQGWVLLRAALLMAALLLFACASEPTRPTPHSGRGVQDPLTRIDASARDIAGMVPENKPVVDKAKDIRKDVAAADVAVEDLLAEIDGLGLALREARSDARKKYVTLMYGIQALCALAGIAGLACMFIVPGLKAAAGGVALAGGVGFFGIMAANAAEEFVYRYAMPIGAGAIVMILLIGAWVIIRHVRANKDLTQVTFPIFRKHLTPEQWETVKAELQAAVDEGIITRGTEKIVALLKPKARTP